MPKRPKDMNQLGHFIVAKLTGQLPDDDSEDAPKSIAKVNAGSKGGKRGGVARAVKLSPEERSAIAKKAAKARWRRD